MGIITIKCRENQFCDIFDVAFKFVQVGKRLNVHNNNYVVYFLNCTRINQVPRVNCIKYLCRVAKWILLKYNSLKLLHL